jgi:hypothetical protein
LISFISQFFHFHFYNKFDETYQFFPCKKAYYVKRQDFSKFYFENCPFSFLSRYEAEPEPESEPEPNHNLSKVRNTDHHILRQSVFSVLRFSFKKLLLVENPDHLIKDLSPEYPGEAEFLLERLQQSHLRVRLLHQLLLIK